MKQYPEQSKYNALRNGYLQLLHINIVVQRETNQRPIYRLESYQQYKSWCPKQKHNSDHDELYDSVEINHMLNINRPKNTAYKYTYMIKKIRENKENTIKGEFNTLTTSSLNSLLQQIPIAIASPSTIATYTHLLQHILKKKWSNFLFRKKKWFR